MPEPDAPAGPSVAPEPAPPSVAPEPAPARHSLRSRLLRRLLPPLLGLFAISAALSYFGARYHADQVYDRWLVDSAEALAQRVTTDRGGRVVLDLPEAARQIVQWDAADTTWFEVLDERGQHIAGQPKVPAPAASGRGEWLRQAMMFGGTIDGAPVRIASVRASPPGSEEAIEVRVAETLRKRQSLAAEVLLSVLLPQVLLVVVAGLVIRFTLQRLLAPVGAVARALEAQTHHSLEPVDDRALPAEVLPLTHALNALLLRLKEALAAQRHFIADAAHQLRTPLTAIKLHADETARETDPQRLAIVVRQLRAAAERAARLSNQLLTLARAEPSGRVGEPQRIALREAVFQSAGEWVPIALRDGIDLGFAGAPDDAGAEPVDVIGDAGLLAQAVDNLIDNAIKYAGRGARITVAVSADRAAGRARVQVTDDGPGIAAADRTRVLQRFHRGEDGADRRPGTGLGLAIVAEIVRGHDGQVDVDAAPGGHGTVVTIDLPIAPPPGSAPRADRAAARPRVPGVYDIT